MHRYIYVRSQFTAIHSWPDAPDPVEFLANRHRHVFKVRIDLEVTHNNRDLEFFIVQKDLEAVLDSWHWQVVNKSCEDFCQAIYDELHTLYPTLFRVEVSEDGENGAVMDWSEERRRAA